MASGQQVSKVGSIPSPIGGLNTRDAWANMSETDAIILDNWFPQPSWVEPRLGTQNWATFTGNCETVAAYNGLTGNKLYAAVNNAGVYSIFDITAGGAAGAAVVGGGGATIQALTSARFDWAIFGTSVEVLLMANGLDPIVQYDGTNWTVAAITGITGGTSTINSIGVYKSRVWYGQKNTFNVWYTAVNAFAGATTVFPLGSLFKLGGSLQAIASISVDNAGGTNDYIAFISSMGEVILYNGTDPSSVTTFALAAHFRIGRPIATGRRCWTKIGMDILLITADGFIMLSEAMLTDRSQQRNNVSDKIRKSVTDDVTNYGNNFGWQVLLYPIGNKIIINVPTAADSASYQYVMNTLSGAWCTFGKFNSPLNAFCWEIQGDNLYYGAAGAVVQADTTQTDNNLGIVVDVQQAFSYFGTKESVKLWKMARATMNATAGINLTMLLNIDFTTTAAPAIPNLSSNTNALWNVSYWSTPTYWSQGAILYKSWQGVGGVGYAAGLRIRLKLLNATAQWQSTDYVYEYGGVLG